MMQQLININKATANWFLILSIACIIHQAHAQSPCCCGIPQEMNFPGLDFEFAPDPPTGWFIFYTAGDIMGTWSVTGGSVDHVDKDHYMGTSYGNPNGPSNYVDLFGSPPGGSGEGIMQYPLTGLTPGSVYTIEFYYATFDLPGNYSATLKIANGAWLNVSWKATNPGNVIWLKASHSFTAKNSAAILEFTDTGGTSSYGQIGMLIDDIKIFECPFDLEIPEAFNPPDDLEVECEQHVPPAIKLIAIDNCDQNPKISFSETIEIIDPCTKKIIRTWELKDACGNIGKEEQIINVIDNNPPQFTTLPESKTFICGDDILKEFNAWIKKNGNAVAYDACGPITWRTNYDHPPNIYCDTILVEFIAKDPCGNERFEFAHFIVKDTITPMFISEAVSKHFDDTTHILDSLRNWLLTFGFSKTNSNCDTIIMSSNFDGDSTKNPIHVTFYAKNFCGVIDSSQASFSYSGNIATCCCGVETELSFSNLDFEAAPAAPPGGWIDYAAGDNYGGWNITSGSVSIHDAGHLNLGAGNPNGSSQHMDLHGFNQGSASYILTGLTAGYRYTISFWYAIHSFGSNVSARLTINGGSLLNVTWNASNTGDVIWLENTYEFTADGPVADMHFIGMGATPCCGMLIDDIRIFECPGDLEMPLVTNPPDDLEVECEKDVPAPPRLNVSDNCDSNPKITLKETTLIIDPCTKKITRNWEIKDACGNIALEDQIIDIIDKNPPQFTKKPENKLVYCQQDVAKEFTDWLKIRGNAMALDNCGPVSWRTNYERLPNLYCDTVLTEFFVTDHCGNEHADFAYFIVKDSSAPKFITQAESKNLVCVPNSRDSLRVWLTNFGYSKTIDNCDTVLLSHNFNGDSTKNPLVVVFYAKDRCGNIDSSKAIFSYRSGSDTFHIINFSCNFSQNSSDTLKYLVNGCDSIVILKKIKLESDSTYVLKNTCDPLQSQFDTLYLSNASACDSTIFLEYVLRQIPQTVVQLLDCKYNLYARDSIIHAGQYCDSLVITEYIPLPKDSVSIQFKTCDKSQEDTIVLSLKNIFGCDSIVRIATTYTSQQITLRTIQECGIQKNYSDTVTFVNGVCDSLVITLHIALAKDTTMIQNSTCEINKAGMFTRTFINRLGCDSVVFEEVLLLPSDSLFLNSTTCIESQAGINVQRLRNKYNCDSIITTTTIFIPSDTSILNTFTCDKSQQRNDTMWLVTQFCDSVIITNTIFIASDTLSLNLITCIPAEAGVDTMVLQNVGGCDSLVFMTKTFVPKNLILQLDSITCRDKHDGSISILNANDFATPFEFIINNQIFSNLFIADSLAAGNYTLLIRDKNGCLSDSIKVQLLNPGAFTTDLGSDLLLDIGQVIALNLSSNKIPEFIYWYPQGISSCIQCHTIDYKAQQEEWIYTLAIDDRGCESRDSILIRVKKERKIFAPNVISNNGDNINDNFYLIGDDDLIIELLEIYDRWGELLFTTTNTTPNNPESGWDGGFKGQKMNPGVYVYYVKIKHPSGDTDVLKGDFTLIR